MKKTFRPVIKERSRLVVEKSRRLVADRPRAVVASLLASLLVLAASAAPSSAAQMRKREYMTAQEVEAVREAQALDARTGVFVRVIERRLKMLAGETPAASAPVKTETGEVLTDTLTRTRGELLADIAYALDEAIENIDDTAARAPESPLVGKSAKRLASAAQKFLAQLQPLRQTLTARSERESLEQAIDNLEQIIEASKKVKDEPADDKAKKKGGEER